MKATHLYRLFLASDRDVVLARRKSREIAAGLRFDANKQVRIATSVSEIARNALAHAGGGEIKFELTSGAEPNSLRITVRDRGPGIRNLRPDLDRPAAPPGKPATGLLGARLLMDEFVVESSPGKGTTVLLGMRLPEDAPAPSSEALKQIGAKLRVEGTGDAFQEVQTQNQELLKALDELRRRQEQLVQLNHELDYTNRGVVALYAELEEKAASVKRADELKTRFLSNMSHEFRTPVNSILGLVQILLAEMDGPLTPEQRKQLEMVVRSASELSELISDLLDLAKIEAGKTVVRWGVCHVEELFSSLRGMLRPLLSANSVEMLFEPPQGVPPIVTDITKLSQILRNLIANALKFTSAGEIRITASHDPAEGCVVFRVADTGIGIAPADFERIFDEFVQAEASRSKAHRGTGLGLPISRRLARLLEGDLVLEHSVPGAGSVFAVRVPIQPANYAAPESSEFELPPQDPHRRTVLVVDDDPLMAILCEKLMPERTHQFIPALTVRAARAALERCTPGAIILDLLMPEEDPWAFLAELKQHAATASIPVFVATVAEGEEPRVTDLGADGFCVKPVKRRWLLEALRRSAGEREAPRVLVVDDDETARYVVKHCLNRTRYQISEAGSGAEGIRLARELRPDVILLDLMMPGMTGFEVLDHLRADEATRDIPVIILTSHDLTGEERQGLEKSVLAVQRKQRVGQADGVEELRAALLRAVEGTSK